MKTYAELDLPPLPEPWFWVEGEDDGDPIAEKVERGWRISVHEAVACSYSDELVTLVRREGDRGGTRLIAGVPLPVYQAVYLALRQWYGEASVFRYENRQRANSPTKFRVGE